MLEVLQLTAKFWFRIGMRCHAKLRLVIITNNLTCFYANARSDPFCISSTASHCRWYIGGVCTLSLCVPAFSCAYELSSLWQLCAWRGSSEGGGGACGCGSLHVVTYYSMLIPANYPNLSSADLPLGALSSAAHS